MSGISSPKQVMNYVSKQSITLRLRKISFISIFSFFLGFNV